MNIYITSGTPSFLESIIKKYKGIGMIQLYGEGTSLLIHETDDETIFQTPRRYEVIGSTGSMSDHGYFVFNNIPVTDEGRPLFEHQSQSFKDIISNQPGFIAFRLLRPLDSDTYIVVTEWSDEKFYNQWKDSASFTTTKIAETAKSTTNSTAHLFSSAAYITSYWTNKEDEQE